MIAEGWSSRDRTPARLEAEETATCRGDAHRPARIRRMGDRHYAGGNGSRRPAGGAAGRPAGIEGVAADGAGRRFACEREAHFRHGGQSEEAKACSAEPLCQIAVFRDGGTALEHVRSGRNWKAGKGAAQILGKARDAEEWWNPPAARQVAQAGVRIFCGRSSERWVDVDDCACFCQLAGRRQGCFHRFGSGEAAHLDRLTEGSCITCHRQAGYLGSSVMRGTSKAPDLISARLASMAASASAGATPLT